MNFYPTSENLKLPKICAIHSHGLSGGFQVRIHMLEKNIIWRISFLKNLKIYALFFFMQII